MLSSSGAGGLGIVNTGVCKINTRYSRVPLFVSAPPPLHFIFDPIRAGVQWCAKYTPDLVMRRRATTSLLEFEGFTWGCVWLSLALVTGVHFANTCSQRTCLRYVFFLIFL